MGDAGIVTGGDGAAAKLFGAPIQAVELQKAVAVDTGIGRFAARIGADKAVDHPTAEIVGEVEDIIRHAQPICHAVRILRVLQ